VIIASAELSAKHSTITAFSERSLPLLSDNKTIVFFTPKRIYILKRKIHGRRKKAKRKDTPKGYTKEKKLYK
jgi:hypothetical protein